MGTSPEGQLGSITKRALFDELVKLAEVPPAEPKKGGVGKALRAMAVGGAGLGLGYGISELAVRKLPFFSTAPSSLAPEAAKKLMQQRGAARKIILPILSGVAVMLADRYRQHMNEQYQQVPGFNG
jgi:hypothetical protein